AGITRTAPATQFPVFMTWCTKANLFPNLGPSKRESKGGRGFRDSPAVPGLRIVRGLQGRPSSGSRSGVVQGLLQRGSLQTRSAEGAQQPQGTLLSQWRLQFQTSAIGGPSHCGFPQESRSCENRLVGGSIYQVDATARVGPGGEFTSAIRESRQRH